MQHASECREALHHSLSQLYLQFCLHSAHYGIPFLPYYDSSRIVTVKLRLLLIRGNYSHCEKVKTLGSWPFCILPLWCIFISPGVNMKWWVEMHTHTYHQTANDRQSSQACLHLLTPSSFCPHCILPQPIADDLSGLKFSLVSLMHRTDFSWADYQLLMKD